MSETTLKNKYYGLFIKISTVKTTEGLSNMKYKVKANHKIS